MTRCSLGGRKVKPGVKAAQAWKFAVLGIAEVGGRVHLETVAKSQSATLKAALDTKLSPEASKVRTDKNHSYCSIIPPEKHERTNHTKKLKEFGTASTMTVEGVFSLFTRGVVGSYHKLSKDHPDSYLEEFCWRYNRRNMQPWMFQNLLREVATKKPMTYKTLTRDVF